MNQGNVFVLNGGAKKYVHLSPSPDGRTGRGRPILNAMQTR